MMMLLKEAAKSGLCNALLLTLTFTLAAGDGLAWEQPSGDKGVGHVPDLGTAGRHRRTNGLDLKRTWN